MSRLGDWAVGLIEKKGYTVQPNELVRLREAESMELSAVSAQLDMLGWEVLNYHSGETHEVRPEQRKSWARKARYAWLIDPLLGAAVDLKNDFVFGRGVPKPRAKDEMVQEVLDEFHDDPDNQRVLTSYEAQLALGTDLELQSNIFVLLFDEGEDGKVKLGLLNHDEVDTAVLDPDFRQRVLYYVTKERRAEWDFENDRLKIDPDQQIKAKVKYYRHWQLDLEEEGERDLPKPPKSKQGVGKVYHVRVNRTSEMVFGAPAYQRVLKWVTALNEFAAARVDFMKAASAFFMKRKIKGSPNQLTKLASKALSRSSELATGYMPEGVVAPPMRSASILSENETLSHEPLKIDSGAAAAADDARLLRAMFSAATRWPQHYVGDAETANLATATSMELPVLKAVEGRQEIFEGLFRWAYDRAIEKAVEKGRLPTKLEGEQLSEAIRKIRSAPDQWAWVVERNGDGESHMNIARIRQWRDTSDPARPWRVELAEAYEDQGQDEKDTERDLSYTFSLPPILRRAMPDVVNAWATTARTFDPNNTNIELSRIALSSVFTDAFEMQNAQELVEQIFPEGYVDPAVAAAQQAAGPNMFAPPPDQFAPGQQPPGPGQPEGSQSAGAQFGGGNTQYGASGGAVPPEQQQIRQAEEVVLSGRAGQPVRWPGRVKASMVPHKEARMRTMGDEFTDDVVQPALDALDRLDADSAS